MVERSIEMMVGILGIIKSGAAYLPIDSLFPRERISYILEDSGASIIVTDKKPGGPINHRCKIVEAANGNLYGRDSHNPGPAAASTDLLYTIYTSGSTGRPKGVMIANRSMVNFITGFTGIIDIGVKDSVLSLTTISFDIFGLEAILPLTTGAKVIIGTEEEQLYPESAARTMVDECTNILQVTPSRLLMLISDEESPPALKSLKYLLVGGEALPAPLLEKAREATAGRIYNLYGPTETTIWSTVKEVSQGKALNIGKPIANTRIYILGQDGTLKPLGAAGELYISGDGLARGYINNVQLTAAKFTGNPREKNHRLYLTGDIARWLPDGNIEFFGRKDHQVKIRGFRIELSEIESQLVKHPGIKEAVVISRGDSGDKHLCAYIVSGVTGTGEETVEIADIKEYLSHTLPDYMIPSYFVLLEKIPLTPSGKIDRGALPSPQGTAGKEYAAPRNEIEKKLVEIWAPILNRTHTNLGIDDNFFELGGHSLKAITMAAKIQKIFNIKLSLTEIFKNSTIRGMSRYLQKAGSGLFASIEPAEKRKYYDLSSVQKRFYTLQQLEVDNTVYNIAMFMRVSGDLKVEQTERIFRLLQKRHDSLRTSFIVINGELVQWIRREAVFAMEYHQSTREGAADIVKNFVRTFDLNQAPLFRVGLIRVGPGQHILMVDMHHIITDAVSMGILIRDFAALYEGKKLPHLKLQYKDYCQWQNSDTQKENLKKQKDYWLQKFAGGVPVLDIPLDFPRPQIQSFEGNCLFFEISPQQTDGLKKLAIEAGTTLYMVVLSVYYILLSKLSGQDDVVVGAVSVGRRHEDLRRIIGVFVNTLALAAQPKGSKTFNTFSREVKEQTLEAFENQDINLEELMNDKSLKRDVSRNPLYDVFFELQETDAPLTEMEGLKYTPIQYEHQKSMFDMNFSGVESRGRLSFMVEYCIKLFKEETMARFISYFKELTTNVLLNPEQKISDLEILSREEKKTVLQQIRKKKTQPHLNLTETMTDQQNAVESEHAEFDF
jgi:amino acid adenylation domain-containing protein